MLKIYHNNRCKKSRAGLQFLKDNKIMATFHYVPLHLSPAGKIYGKFIGVDEYTTIESNKLIRLPIFYNMELEYVLFVCDIIKKFFNNKKEQNCPFLMIYQKLHIEF